MDPTHDLTRAIAAGDRQAFARFYEEWFDRIYTIARSSTRRDESFCLDVTQDVFLKAIHAMKPLDSHHHLAAWLHRTTLRAAFDRIRAERRTAVREKHHASPSPSALLDHDELQSLRDQLAALDASTVSLLNARYRLGWTLDRIGAALGLKPGAVDGRLRRATSRLSNAMDPRDD